MNIKGYNVDKYNKRVIYTLRSLLGLLVPGSKKVHYHQNFDLQKFVNPKILIRRDSY